MGPSFSSELGILDGVPRGSILGSFTFNIGICDITFDIANCDDDTTSYECDQHCDNGSN